METPEEGGRVMLLLGAMAGFLVSVALLVWGLRSGDRWLAVVAGIALVFFVGAIGRFAGTL
jgi:hypothetical protein